MCWLCEIFSLRAAFWNQLTSTSLTLSNTLSRCVLKHTHTPSVQTASSFPSVVPLAEYMKKRDGQLAFTHPTILCGQWTEIISFTFNQYCQGPRGWVARWAPRWIDVPPRSRVNDKQRIFRWVPWVGGGETSRRSQGRPSRAWADVHAHKQQLTHWDQQSQPWRETFVRCDQTGDEQI